MQQVYCAANPGHFVRPLFTPGCVATPRKTPGMTSSPRLARSENDLESMPQDLRRTTLGVTMRRVVACAFCGEPNEIWIDPSGGSHQSYVEDCQVCCQPWQVDIRFDDEGEVEVNVEQS